MLISSLYRYTVFQRYCIFAKLCFAILEVMIRCHKPLLQWEQVKVVAPLIRSIQEIQQGTTEVESCQKVLRKILTFSLLNRLKRVGLAPKKKPACLLFVLSNYIIFKKCFLNAVKCSFCLVIFMI